MADKKAEPNVYFPTDESGRIGLILALDNIIGDKPANEVHRQASPRKPRKEKKEDNKIEI